MKTSTSDDVDVSATNFCSDYILFSNEFRNKLDDDAFNDAVDNIYKTATLATDDTVPTSND